MDNHGNIDVGVLPAALTLLLAPLIEPFGNIDTYKILNVSTKYYNKYIL